MSDDALPVPPERWNGDLAYLNEIPVADRPQWRLAPPLMNYTMAHDWACRVRASRILPLSTGETLVRLPAPRQSPWALPEWK